MIKFAIGILLLSVYGLPLSETLKDTAIGLMLNPAAGQYISHDSPVSQSIIEANARNAACNMHEYVAPPAPVRNIAEFEPMEGVLIRHPVGIPYALIKEMAKDLVVYCATGNSQAASSDFSQQGINMNNVTFINSALESYWTRDYGPWWVTDGDGKISIVDVIYYRTDQKKTTAFL